MLPIEINVRSSGRKITAYLPDSHAELAALISASEPLARQYLSAFGSANFIGMRVAIVRHVLGRKLFYQALPEDIDHIASFLDYLRPDSLPPYRLLSPDHIGWRPYHWPADKFDNGTLREYMLMDQYCEDYLRGDDAAIPLIAATIFRRSDKDTQRAHRRGDLRTPIQHESQVYRNLDHLRRYGSGWHSARWQRIQMHALHYALAIKMYIRKTYGPWIFSQEASEEQGDYISFGWYSTALHIAETGTFGDVDQVLDSRMHDICVYLVEKKQQTDKIEEERQRIQSKTKAR
jgi:hypothetical protein